MNSGQGAFDGSYTGVLYDLNLFADIKLPAFTQACGNASFKLDPILVQKSPNPTKPGENKNGGSRVAAIGVSGLAFVWGVIIFLL